MKVISNTEHYTLYGIDVTYDKAENIYITFIGGKKYEAPTLGTMQYKIQNLQSGVGVVH